MNIGFTEMDGLLILKEAAALRYEEVYSSYEYDNAVSFAPEVF